MNHKEIYPTRIAIGWLSLLLLLVVMLVFMIVFSALDNDEFASLRRDPGRGGLRMMTYVVGIYALMPILVQIVDRWRMAAARWIMVAAAAGNIMFMLMHHLSHWHGGDRPNFNSHVLDLAIHAVGLWVLYNSIRWARAGGNRGDSA